MSKKQWETVDEYITDLLNPVDQLSEALEYSLASSQTAGMPNIAVSAAQGKMLKILAQSVKAERILEIGTLGGYSTIWLASALPDNGKLVTLEFAPKHAAVASTNLVHAKLDSKVEILIGAAMETLPKLALDKRAPFDFIFIDADKENYPGYFDWSLRLSRPGTLIVADNVVRDGAILDPHHEDTRVQGIRKFNERVARERRVDATILQTVGSKGYDGFALIYVRE